MLTSKKKEAAPLPGNSINVIGADTIIEGNIISKGDVRIDGQLIGSIKTSAKVVLGTTGKIEGDLEAKSADISGQIKGNLDVADVLFLKQTSKVVGDVKTGKLVVESGGEFNGKCTMGGNAIPIASRASNEKSETANR
ncbi:MAG: cell shape determination protein CcmA [Bacteroidetes bacterium]|nr:cell shape determination protein CcmA [Bacteroidota bacterium]